MTTTIYTMAAGMKGDRALGSFPMGRTASFADQMAIDDQRAAEECLAMDVPAVRMDRVKHLKALIEEGRYFVSSADVAERVMASMLSEGAKRLH